MAWKVITMPFDMERGEFADRKFRELLDRAEVRSVKSAFFHQGGQAYWSVFVEYSPRTDGDHRAALTDEAKRRYDAVREWRNARAEAEGIPPYVIASNRQLAEMAAIQEPDKEKLSRIKGWGAPKNEKYSGDILLALLSKPVDETPEAIPF